MNPISKWHQISYLLYYLYGSHWHCMKFFELPRKIERCDSGSYVATLFDSTRVLEWRITRIVVTNGHKKDICNNGVWLYAQNTNIILGSSINTIGTWESQCDHSKRKRIFIITLLRLYAIYLWIVTWNGCICDTPSLTGQDDYLHSKGPNSLWSWKCPQGLPTISKHFKDIVFDNNIKKT